MDLQTISEQIKANLNQFNEKEKRIIILQLLNFIRDLETENEELKAEKARALEQLETVKSEQVSEALMKERIDQILNEANEEAKRIKDQALKDGEQYLAQMQEQGRKYMLEFLDRLKDVVMELQRIDEEAKTYRMHILTALRSTLYRFADNDYHLLKLDDQNVKELIQFFKRDAELQTLADQLMDRLNRFERYLALVQQSEAIDPKDIQRYLKHVQIIDAPEVEKVVDGLKPADTTEPVDEPIPKAGVDEAVREDEPVAKRKEEESIPSAERSMPVMANLSEDSEEEDLEEDEDTTYMRFLDIFNQYSKPNE